MIVFLVSHLIICSYLVLILLVILRTVWEPHGTHITPQEKGESYLAEQFSQMIHFLAEQFCQISHYLAEQFRQFKWTLLPEMHPLALSSHLCIHFLNSSQSHSFKYCQNPNSTSTQRQLNNNSMKVGFDTKMTLHTTPPHHPQKLNVCNISAVTDPILTKL